MIRLGIILSGILLLASCKQTQFEPISEVERAELMTLGDSISNVMQGVLLGKVGQAIKKGGTDYAIEFCNIEAMPLTDSISEQFDVQIQRLSEKNRNPKNGITSDMDALAMEKIKSDKEPFIKQSESGEVYYYKPIPLGMPACIQCHGKKSEIASSTLELIELKYPEDKAIDYEMGDLRGMWKIKM